MKPHWFYILLSVSGAPRYGSAIQEDVRTLSDDRVRLWPATLYGSLEELTEAGWLEEMEDTQRPGSRTGRERFYRLTQEGSDALRAHVERMEELTSLARARMTEGMASS